MGDFRVGAVLSRGIVVAIRNLPAFLIIGILCFSPFIVLALLPVTVGWSPLGPGALVAADVLLALIFSEVTTAAVTYGTISQLRGQPAGIGRCVSVGFQRLLPVIGATLLMALGIAGGLILLIVPGIILACTWYVVIPVIVVERTGVIAAFSRSAALTRGFRGGIFGLFFIVYVFQEIVERILEAAQLGPLIYVISLLVVLVVSGIFRATVSAVAYNDLRSVHDGVNVDDIAAVFD